ncbi:unnamed protein product [Rotaria sp. Silwood2]|nr:unnamed protein product [Rotaria sp. Silwood2]
MKVFDAWGKPLPSGLLKGNVFWLGNYDECINPLYQINNKSFVRQLIDTQYCALQSNPNKQQVAVSSGLILGLCLPASCTRQSIVTLIREIFKLHNLTKDYLHCSNDRSSEQIVSIGSILGLLLYYPSMVTHALDISNNATGPNFFDKIYMTPWCRISPYAIGLFTGFLVVNTGRTYHLNSFVRLIGNLIATALALACIFSIYGDYVLVPGLSRASLIVYQTLSRPAWSISISWLIFCVVSIKVVLSIEYYLFPFGHR